MEIVDKFDEIAPGIPVWLTEAGATGTDDPAYWDDVALYLKNLYAEMRIRASRVPVVMWYAWSDAMDVAQKTNGLVTRNGEKKPYVYDAFFEAACP
jgi:hypothetical protein